MEYAGGAFPPVMLGNVMYEEGDYEQGQEEEWWPQEQEEWQSKAIAAVTKGKGNTEEDKKKEKMEEEMNGKFTFQFHTCCNNIIIAFSIF